MGNELKFYINGQWVGPVEPGKYITVINPATEKEVTRIAAGNDADLDIAVHTAQRAFQTYSRTSREERVALMEKLLEAYQYRLPEIIDAIITEIGAPRWLVEAMQAPAGAWHIATALEVLKTFSFEEQWGTTRIVREPIGVAAMIAPWNWPMNQVVCKVAPALAVGCTIVLKPSQKSPLVAQIFAEAVHEAGFPAGVFNMINGAGSLLGEAMSRHPLVDMVSITGSTQAGVAVARAACDTVKRISQELGGKSANILLDDVNLEEAVTGGVQACMQNSGQSCNAPTRMLIPVALYQEAVAIAEKVANALVVGDPQSAETFLGPVANENQYETVIRYIKLGLSEGAKLVAGGTEKPKGLACGYYVKPTIFADVHNDMRIAQEEIFGPVLVMIPYKNEEEAIAIANDSNYGLSGYVISGDLDRARAVARRMRTGMVHLNGAMVDLAAPFGGYKQSGNGREWGKFGFEEYLETKAIMGFEPPPAQA